MSSPVRPARPVTPVTIAAERLSALAQSLDGPAADEARATWAEDPDRSTTEIPDRRSRFPTWRPTR